MKVTASASGYNGCTRESLRVIVDPNNRFDTSSSHYYDSGGNLTQITGLAPTSFTYDSVTSVTRMVTDLIGPIRTSVHSGTEIITLHLVTPVPEAEFLKNFGKVRYPAYPTSVEMVKKP